MSGGGEIQVPSGGSLDDYIRKLGDDLDNSLMEAIDEFTMEAGLDEGEAGHLQSLLVEVSRLADLYARDG